MAPEKNINKDSEYQVIARKWRPQGFKDIVGQEHITRTLQNSLNSGRIAHAFLFSGLRGVGKTTTARILAKALNCQEGISSEPCNKCVSCLEIREGNSVDVQEIDGASNRGIDSIRELRESVRYGTSRDRFKVFIIDEVHMLTREAFNGLLKTLEEPPGHVKFIMATTEFYKIPPTIQSRCQKYEFKPIPPGAMLEHLKVVTSAEGIEISESSLRSIVSLAQGSLRDAQSALDQVISFCGKKAEDADVKALLGVVDFKAVADVFDAVVNKDSHRVLEVYRDLVLKGVETDILCREMMEHVRNLMVVKVAGWDERLIQLAESGREGLEKCAEIASEQDLVRYYNLLEQTASELRRVSRPEIHLEMSLVKMVQLARLPELEKVLESVMSSGTGMGLNPTGTRAAAEKKTAPAARPPLRPKRPAMNKPPSSPVPAVGKTEKKTRLTETDQKEVSPNAPESETPGSANSAPVAPESGAPGEAGELAESAMVQAWLDKLKDKSMMLFQHLGRADEIELAGDELKTVTAWFPHDDAFHANQVSRRKDDLKKLFAETCGITPRIVVSVREAQAKDEDQDPTEDPRIKAFLKRYPGRITVRKKGNRHQ